MEPVYVRIETALQAIVIRDALDLAKRLEAESAAASKDPLERIERLRAVVDQYGPCVLNRAVAAAMERPTAVAFRPYDRMERYERESRRRCNWPESMPVTFPPPGVTREEHRRAAFAEEARIKATETTFVDQCFAATRRDGAKPD